MTTRESFREFLKAFSKLKQKVVDDGAVVLVEGERDRASLTSLGIPRDSIIMLNRGETLVSVVDALVQSGRPVALLLDWDRKGSLLTRRLSTLLRGTPLDIDLETRRRFAKALRGEVVEVENLHSWAERSSKVLEEPMEIELPTTL
jgi:5S rRNA maturation endonuclease (ribonuclease M5)